MCNCKTEIEAKLVDGLKLKHPDATGHSATLQGYGFAIVNNTMHLMPYMPFKYGADHITKKTGQQRRKDQKGNLTFNFCPFCGVSLKQGPATPT